MQRLIKSTTAYKIFSADMAAGKLSHAYMLHFADPKNLRAALMLFALEYFGDNPACLPRVQNLSYPDFTFYPPEGKKISVEGVSAIIEDTALRAVEGSKKLYIISGFETAGAVVQNKLLKTLEEPLAGICFILGACSLAPVLNTVLSRVKLLEIPPFSEREIFEMLQRQGENPLNAEAAKRSGGIPGAAQNMVEGGWFAEVREAAREICSVQTADVIPGIVKKYGDTKYKEELLNEIQGILFSALTGGESLKYQKHTLIYALELINRAFADLKYNAFFQGLLYDYMLKVVKENDKWQKLQA